MDILSSGVLDASIVVIVFAGIISCCFVASVAHSCIEYYREQREGENLQDALLEEV